MPILKRNFVLAFLNSAKKDGYFHSTSQIQKAILEDRKEHISLDTIREALKEIKELGFDLEISEIKVKRPPFKINTFRIC